MKFILNTAIDPHFCTVFDEKSAQVFHKEWRDRRRDGAELFEFLKQQDVSSFTFLGGITGPGGFSSLRIGTGVLNVLAFTTGLPVHAVRADGLQKALLSDRECAVILNSFGDGVWIQEGAELIRKTAFEASALFSSTPVCVSWLPPEKQKLFQNPVFIEMENAPKTLLQLLQETKEQDSFMPDYEVPPV